MEEYRIGLWLMIAFTAYLIVDHLRVLLKLAGSQKIVARTEQSHRLIWLGLAFFYAIFLKYRFGACGISEPLQLGLVGPIFIFLLRAAAPRPKQYVSHKIGMITIKISGAKAVQVNLNDVDQATTEHSSKVLHLNNGTEVDIPLEPFSETSRDKLDFWLSQALARRRSS